MKTHYFYGHVPYSYVHLPDGSCGLEPLDDLHVGDPLSPRSTDFGGFQYQWVGFPMDPNTV